MADLRAVRQSAWLGWKLVSNWANPLVFSIYYVARPLAGLLIIGAVYLVGSLARGRPDPDYLSYIFVGGAFFAYIMQVVRTMSLLIHQDRAQYEVFRHIYVSPGSLRPYLLGRALASSLDGLLSTTLTLSLGLLIFTNMLGLEMPLDLARINPLALAMAMTLGITSTISMGYILCAVNLLTSRLRFDLDEYVLGAFFLFGGVVIPMEALPGWARVVSSFMPVTYFLGSVRASLGFEGWGSFLPELSYLAVATALTGLAAYVIFRWAEDRARRQGILDRKAEY